MSQGKPRGGRGEDVSFPQSFGGIQPALLSDKEFRLLASRTVISSVVLSLPVLSTLVWQS